MKPSIKRCMLQLFYSPPPPPPSSYQPPHLWLLFLCSRSLVSFFPSLPFFHPPLFLSICICCALCAGTCIAVPLLVLGQLPHSSVLALVHPPPTFLLPLLLLLLLFFPFCMCARVRGARHSAQPSGLKVNTYVIANCLQSLGAALKKDMLRRQLRPLAFASLSDRICFKGLVHIIFNPRALCAPWTTGGRDKGYILYAEFCNMKNVWRVNVDSRRGGDLNWNWLCLIFLKPI